jgi:hypothetical protein
MKRRVWVIVTSLGLTSVAAWGCQETPKRPVIRPPKEDFHAPPEGLFKDRIEYPKDLLNQVTPRRKKDEDPFAQPAGPVGGAMGAMPQ